MGRWIRLISFTIGIFLLASCGQVTDTPLSPAGPSMDGGLAIGGNAVGTGSGETGTSTTNTASTDGTEEAPEPEVSDTTSRGGLAIGGN